MIPFYLVTGFLGSGKTTLLKNILHRYAGEKRIAIIQNEFAATGTDGKELELTGAGFKLVEVNNGSVFCVCMLGNFAASIAKVIDEYKPELIFLEASGLSDPINILELLQDKLICDLIGLSRIFTIEDVQNFDRAIKMVTRARHQVMIADTVLINKTDLLPGAVSKVRAAIEEMNPFAEIIGTTYCEFSQHGDILSHISNHRAAESYGRKTGEGRPDMKAVVLRINKLITPEGIRSFVAELQPDCPRIKGYVNSTDGSVYMIQSVFDTFEYRITEGYKGPTEIIAFGMDLTPGLLREKFVNHCSQSSDRN
jgi:G3E family GTPase